jgi:glycosyltransferase involved in cell wall biosynthesis
MPTSILVITGIYPPDSGGPAKFAYEFGSWLTKKNISVSIQTYSDANCADFVSKSIRVFFVSRSISLLKRYPLMIRAIGKQVSMANATIAVGAFIETFFASIIFRFPYVAKVPGDIVWERARNNGVSNLDIEEFQEHSPNLKYKLFRFLYSRSLRRAQMVIVPSLGLQNLCLRWGVPKEKLRVIHNSVSGSFTTIQSSQKKFNLITVCRLTRWKGVDELIEFAAKRNLALMVVGDGPDIQRLRMLSLSLGAKVEFSGQVRSEQVEKFLLESELFVLNSYYEGLPHALVEARAIGILSVGRFGTGSAEVINDDIDGYLIRPDRSLESTLDLALSSSSNRNMFISRAKEDVFQRFSSEVNFNAILSTIVKTQ